MVSNWSGDCFQYSEYKNEKKRYQNRRNTARLLCVVDAGPPSSAPPTRPSTYAFLFILINGLFRCLVESALLRDPGTFFLFFFFFFWLEQILIPLPLSNTIELTSMLKRVTTKLMRRAAPSSEPSKPNLSARKSAVTPSEKAALEAKYGKYAIYFVPETTITEKYRDSRTFSP
jgi:hypothetical protein